MPGLLAVAGERNNQLTLVSLHQRRRGGYRWLAQCDCGKTTIVIVQDFRSGHTKSCGCYMVARRPFFNRKHGMSESAEFRIWCHMINRCGSPSDKKFRYYGARGITVCERWLSFENFLADMGARPSVAHSIDRKENDRGYEPNNCRWATPIEQAQNKSNNVFVVLGGERVVVAEAERRLGIGYGSINQRARKKTEPYQAVVEHFVKRQTALGNVPARGNA